MVVNSLLLQAHTWQMPSRNERRSALKFKRATQGTPGYCVCARPIHSRRQSTPIGSIFRALAEVGSKLGGATCPRV